MSSLSVADNIKTLLNYECCTLCWGSSAYVNYALYKRSYEYFNRLNSELSKLFQCLPNFAEL